VCVCFRVRVYGVDSVSAEQACVLEPMYFLENDTTSIVRIQSGEEMEEDGSTAAEEKLRLKCCNWRAWQGKVTSLYMPLGGI